MNGTCDTATALPDGMISAEAATSIVRDSTLSVWLVDDNDGFRHTLADVLGRHRGIQCARNFSSPDAALSALASHVGPDVILLDVQMRDRNGLDAIGPIKALSRQTQVLMLTSSYDPEGYQRALAAGASDFLLKSYTAEEIVRRIRNPSRRVNARRSKPVTPTCPATQSRAQTTLGKKATSQTKIGLGFFRRWLGVNA